MFYLIVSQENYNSSLFYVTSYINDKWYVNEILPYIKNGTLLILDIWDYLIDISFIIYVGGHVKDTLIVILLDIYGIEHQHQHVHKLQS